MAAGIKFMGLLTASIVALPVALAGDLNPPVGPVAPTHKTLTEVEPRIAVNATNTPGDATNQFRITQPGSYYLTGNITGVSGRNGILIDSNGVTLDLMGFTLRGVSGSLDGITMVAFRENIIIRNGHVRDWGRHGLQTRFDIGRIEGIAAARNGGWGIDNQPAQTFTTHIVGCEAFANGGGVASTGGIRAGERAIVADCISRSNTGPGFATGGGGVRFERCQSGSNQGDGFSASTSDNAFIGCTADANGGAGNVGIRAGARAVLTQCVANGQPSDGILLGSACVVTNSTTNGNSGHGINANGSHCRIENCAATGNNQSGIRALDRALVTGCAAGQNNLDNIVVGGSSSVINCIANSSTAGHGINASFTQSLVQGCTTVGNALSGVRASQRTRVQGCVVSNNTLHGVHITFGGAVEECFINFNQGDGILMDSGGVVTIRNNTISESNSVGDAGIRVTSSGGCHIEGNSVTLCNIGILVVTSANTVVRNSALGNATNFNIAAGNTAGPIVTPATAASATNPLANYSN